MVLFKNCLNMGRNKGIRKRVQGIPDYGHFIETPPADNGLDNLLDVFPTEDSLVKDSSRANHLLINFTFIIVILE